MTEEVYIIGSASTVFGKWTDKSFKELTREAYEAVLADAEMETGVDIEAAWFGNCFLQHWDQALVRGNVCFIPLVRDGIFPDRAPIFNVEGACATGSVALASAAREIQAGAADVTLAIGVEKMNDPQNPKSLLRQISGGIDQLDPDEWRTEYKNIAHQIDDKFEEGPNRSIAMDIYGLQAKYHMKTYGSTQEQIAVAAAKNHNNGALNDKAHYRFEMTPEEVLADREVSWPFTRSMCAPMTDGAAAAIVCSKRYLTSLPQSVQDRAVCLRASVFTGGKYRGLNEPGLTHTAARRAYEQAGIKPSQIDVAEVHDASSFCEIYQAEMLGFCDIGEGGSFVASGATKIGGSIPINTSGGLVSKGHPIGATGLSMAYELVTQLRGEAGERQVEGATIALQENGGGIIGMEEALAAVTIYERLN